MASKTKKSVAAVSASASCKKRKITKKPAIFSYIWRIKNFEDLFYKIDDNRKPVSRLYSKPFTPIFDPGLKLNFCLHPNELTNKSDYMSLSLHVYEQERFNFPTKKTIKIDCEVQLQIKGGDWDSKTTIKGTLQKDKSTLIRKKFIKKSYYFYPKYTTKDDEIFIRCLFKPTGHFNIKDNFCKEIFEERCKTNAKMRSIIASNIGVIENFNSKVTQLDNEDNEQPEATTSNIKLIQKNSDDPVVTTDLWLKGRWPGCKGFISAGFKLEQCFLEKNKKIDFDKVYSKIAICAGKTEHHVKVFSRFLSIEESERTFSCDRYVLLDTIHKNSRLYKEDVLKIKFEVELPYRDVDVGKVRDIKYDNDKLISLSNIVCNYNANCVVAENGNVSIERDAILTYQNNPQNTS